MLVMSGGEGYIDFRVGSTNAGNDFCVWGLVLRDGNFLPWVVVFTTLIRFKLV